MFNVLLCRGEDLSPPVFNLGIGMVLVVPESDQSAAAAACEAAGHRVSRIGEVVAGTGKVHLTN